MGKPLPEYARMDMDQGANCGTTNTHLYGSPVTRTGTYTGGYQDTRPEAMQDADGWTTAVLVRVETKGRATEHIVRDPDLLASWAAQLLDASIHLRRILESD